ncbi:MAG: enoyl-CoA hydratase-related protein [Smithellaceae bacterium]|nr:enoyl-CoA hydratase-related protein [Smithellaceae bacterium]
MEKSVLVDIRNRVCTLTMNRPEVMNAFNEQMIEDFQDALDRLRQDEEVNVVVLQGAGGNFSSGAELSPRNYALSHNALHEIMKRLGRWVQTLRELRQPVIGKVRGMAVGGGANLALSCDFVLAAHEAKFIQPFVHIGLMTDLGGTWFLPRLVGLAKARELAILGNKLSGSDAASIGLIYKSLADEALDGAVSALAETLAQKSPTAMFLVKKGLDTSQDMSLEEVLTWEAARQTERILSAEHQEAVIKFMQSRSKK